MLKIDGVALISHTKMIGKKSQMDVIAITTYNLTK